MCRDDGTGAVQVIEQTAGGGGPLRETGSARHAGAEPFPVVNHQRLSVAMMVVATVMVVQGKCRGGSDCKRQDQERSGN
jgi:hypothetical protein